MAVTSSHYINSSKYKENVLEHGHSTVWGSFYCPITHCWGYACCLLCQRGANCSRAKFALEAESVANVKNGDTRNVDSPLLPTDSSSDRTQNAEGHASGSVGAEPHSVSEAARARVLLVSAEIERILKAPTSKPLEVLGLTAGSADYLVRSAFRRIALLIHPDKNPGFELQCKQALVKAHEAREAVERAEAPVLSQNVGGEASTAGRKRRHGSPNKAHASTSYTSLAEPKTRAEFDSAATFIEYALQYLLDAWHLHINLVPTSDTGASQAKGVLHSEAILKQTIESVKSLQRLLANGVLGHDILAKIECMCCEMLLREYTTASQVYMDLAIGNRAWHLDVPNLLEGGIGGCTGVERGRLFKQARTAQKLNATRGSFVMDDVEVRPHIVALKRLLTVAQAIRPNCDT